jgi:glucokinase
LTEPGLVLGLDFGGTKHTAGLARAGSAHLLARRRQPSPPGSDAATDLQIMFALARALLDEAGGRPRCVGVSFGGPVDFAAQAVKLSHHVPGWEAVPLRALVEAEFGVPAVVDNDANCGAWGEWRYGAGQGCASLLYLTVSTGVGGGWIVGGQPYRGRDSMAGELGHVPLDPAGPECVCGRRGCVEVLACGPAIARRAREQLLAHPEAGTILRGLAAGDPQALTGEMISRAAAAGDELAQAVLLAAARDLGLGIGSALSLMNPERVVLGGGVTNAGPAWWAEVRRAARANTLPEVSVDIQPAALGEDAPLRGAMALAESTFAVSDILFDR